MGGIPPEPPRRLWLQPLLRALSSLAPPSGRGAAPRAQGRRKLFVDYAGDTVPLHDAKGGPDRPAFIFVAVLGASNYTYAEATWSQGLEDWLGAHVRAFEFFQGVPKLVVPDNARTGVIRACRYEPDLNPAYQEMARHYGVGVLPTRPYKPRDKACSSYCTLFRSDSSRSTAATPFDDRDTSAHLIE